MLAMATPQEGQHHDLFEIKQLFEEICQMLKEAGIDVEGLFLNADPGFDSQEFKDICEEKEIIANIKPNPRKKSPKDREPYESGTHIFDEELYKDRTVSTIAVFSTRMAALLQGFSRKNHFPPYPFVRLSQTINTKADIHAEMVFIHRPASYTSALAVHCWKKKRTIRGCLFHCDFHYIILLSYRAARWVGSHLVQLDQVPKSSERSRKRWVVFRIIRQRFNKCLASLFHFEFGDHPASPKTVGVGGAAAVLGDFKQSDFHAVRFQFSRLIQDQGKGFVELDILLSLESLFLQATSNALMTIKEKMIFFMALEFLMIYYERQR
ncbi:MAG: hypothetical protein IPM82_25420 [Saprospiraceae bacterium]|nr:hypothetical protein [Saprospiraceae bacterium]